MIKSLNAEISADNKRGEKNSKQKKYSFKI